MRLSELSVEFDSQVPQGVEHMACLARVNANRPFLGPFSEVTEIHLVFSNGSRRKIRRAHYHRVVSVGGQQHSVLVRLEILTSLCDLASSSASISSFSSLRVIGLKFEIVSMVTPRPILFSVLAVRSSSCCLIDVAYKDVDRIFNVHIGMNLSVEMYFLI
ncbi:hypothetical protein ACLKA6_000564 [Drosophila palustris]